MAEPPGDPLLAGLAAGRDAAFAALYARDGAALFRVAVALLGSPGRRRGRGAGGVRRPGPGPGVAGGGREPAGVPVHRPAPRRGEGGRPPPGRPPRAAPGRPRRAGTPPLAAGPAARLERALAALPADRREVIALKIDAGLTFREIAAVLGVSPNTAASRYRYALAELRDALGEDRR